jgi:hypothetical protein
MKLNLKENEIANNWILYSSLETNRKWKISSLVPCWENLNFMAGPDHLSASNSLWQDLNYWIWISIRPVTTVRFRLILRFRQQSDIWVTALDANSQRNSTGNSLPNNLYMVVILTIIEDSCSKTQKKKHIYHI